MDLLKSVKSVIILAAVVMLVPQIFTFEVHRACNGKDFLCINETHFYICVDNGSPDTIADGEPQKCLDGLVCYNHTDIECQEPDNITVTTSSIAASINSPDTRKNANLNNLLNGDNPKFIKTVENTFSNIANIIKNTIQVPNRVNKTNIDIGSNSTENFQTNTEDISFIVHNQQSAVETNVSEKIKKTIQHKIDKNINRTNKNCPNTKNLQVSNVESNTSDQDSKSVNSNEKENESIIEDAANRINNMLPVSWKDSGSSESTENLSNTNREFIAEHTKGKVDSIIKETLSVTESIQDSQTITEDVAFIVYNPEKTIAENRILHNENQIKNSESNNKNVNNIGITTENLQNNTENSLASEITKDFKNISSTTMKNIVSTNNNSNFIAEDTGNRKHYLETQAYTVTTENLHLESTKIETVTESLRSTTSSDNFESKFIEDDIVNRIYNFQTEEHANANENIPITQENLHKNKLESTTKNTVTEIQDLGSTISVTTENIQDLKLHTTNETVNTKNNNKIENNGIRFLEETADIQNDDVITEIIENKNKLLSDSHIVTDTLLMSENMTRSHSQSLDNNNIAPSTLYPIDEEITTVSQNNDNNVTSTENIQNSNEENVINESINTVTTESLDTIFNSLKTQSVIAENDEVNYPTIQSVNNRKLFLDEPTTKENNLPLSTKLNIYEETTTFTGNTMSVPEYISDKSLNTISTEATSTDPSLLKTDFVTAKTNELTYSTVTDESIKERNLFLEKSTVKENNSILSTKIDVLDEITTSSNVDENTRVVTSTIAPEILTTSNNDQTTRDTIKLDTTNNVRTTFDYATEFTTEESVEINNRIYLESDNLVTSNVILSTPVTNTKQINELSYPTEMNQTDNVLKQMHTTDDYETNTSVTEISKNNNKKNDAVYRFVTETDKTVDSSTTDVITSESSYIIGNKQINELEQDYTTIINRETTTESISTSDIDIDDRINFSEFESSIGGLNKNQNEEIINKSRPMFDDAIKHDKALNNIQTKSDVINQFTTEITTNVNSLTENTVANKNNNAHVKELSYTTTVNTNNDLHTSITELDSGNSNADVTEYSYATSENTVTSNEVTNALNPNVKPTNSSFYSETTTDLSTIKVETTTPFIKKVENIFSNIANIIRDKIDASNITTSDLSTIDAITINKSLFTTESEKNITAEIYTDVTETSNFLYTTKLNQDLNKTLENVVTVTEMEKLETNTNTDSSTKIVQTTNKINDITNTIHNHLTNTDVNKEITEQTKAIRVNKNEEKYTTFDSTATTTPFIATDSTIATKNIADKLVTEIISNTNMENKNTNVMELNNDVKITTETITTSMKNLNMNTRDSSYTTAENIVSINETESNKHIRATEQSYTTDTATYTTDLDKNKVITEQISTTENQNKGIPKSVEHILSKIAYILQNKNNATNKTTSDLSNTDVTTTSELSYTTENDRTEVSEQDYTISKYTVTTTEPIYISNIDINETNNYLYTTEINQHKEITATITEIEEKELNNNNSDEFVTKASTNIDSSTEVEMEFSQTTSDGAITINDTNFSFDHTTNINLNEETTQQIQTIFDNVEKITPSTILHTTENVDISEINYENSKIINDVTTSSILPEATITTHAIFDNRENTEEVLSNSITNSNLALSEDVQTTNNLLYTTTNKHVDVTESSYTSYTTFKDTTTDNDSTNFTFIYTTAETDTSSNEISNTFTTKLNKIEDVTVANYVTSENILSTSNIEGEVTNNVLHTTEINQNEEISEQTYNTNDNVEKIQNNITTVKPDITTLSELNKFKETTTDINTKVTKSENIVTTNDISILLNEINGKTESDKYENVTTQSYTITDSTSTSDKDVSSLSTEIDSTNTEKNVLGRFKTEIISTITNIDSSTENSRTTNNLLDTTENQKNNITQSSFTTDQDVRTINDITSYTSYTTIDNAEETDTLVSTLASDKFMIETTTNIDSLTENAIVSENIDTVSTITFDTLNTNKPTDDKFHEIDSTFDSSTINVETTTPFMKKVENVFSNIANIIKNEIDASNETNLDTSTITTETTNELLYTSESENINEAKANTLNVHVTELTTEINQDLSKITVIEIERQKLGNNAVNRFVTEGNTNTDSSTEAIQTTHTLLHTVNNQNLDIQTENSKITDNLFYTTKEQNSETRKLYYTTSPESITINDATSISLTHATNTDQTKKATNNNDTLEYNIDITASSYAISEITTEIPTNSEDLNISITSSNNILSRIVTEPNIKIDSTTVENEIVSKFSYTTENSNVEINERFYTSSENVSMTDKTMSTPNLNVEISSDLLYDAKLNQDTTVTEANDRTTIKNVLYTTEANKNKEIYTTFDSTVTTTPFIVTQPTIATNNISDRFVTDIISNMDSSTKNIITEQNRKAENIETTTITTEINNQNKDRTNNLLYNTESNKNIRVTEKNHATDTTDATETNQNKEITEPIHTTEPNKILNIFTTESDITTLSNNLSNVEFIDQRKFDNIETTIKTLTTTFRNIDTEEPNYITFNSGVTNENVLSTQVTESDLPSSTINQDLLTSVNQKQSGYTSFDNAETTEINQDAVVNERIYLSSSTENQNIDVTTSSNIFNTLNTDISKTTRIYENEEITERNIVTVNNTTEDSIFTIADITTSSDETNNLSYTTKIYQNQEKDYLNTNIAENNTDSENILTTNNVISTTNTEKNLNGTSSGENSKILFSDDRSDKFATESIDYFSYTTENQNVNVAELHTTISNNKVTINDILNSTDTSQTKDLSYITDKYQTDENAEGNYEISGNVIKTNIEVNTATTDIDVTTTSTDIFRRFATDSNKEETTNSKVTKSRNILTTNNILDETNDITHTTESDQYRKFNTKNHIIPDSTLTTNRDISSTETELTITEKDISNTFVPEIISTITNIDSSTEYLKTTTENQNNKVTQIVHDVFTVNNAPLTHTTETDQNKKITTQSYTTFDNTAKTDNDVSTSTLNFDTTSSNNMSRKFMREITTNMDSLTEKATANDNKITDVTESGYNLNKNGVTTTDTQNINKDLNFSVKELETSSKDMPDKFYIDTSTNIDLLSYTTENSNVDETENLYTTENTATSTKAINTVIPNVKETFYKTDRNRFVTEMDVDMSSAKVESTTPFIKKVENIFSNIANIIKNKINVSNKTTLDTSEINVKTTHGSSLTTESGKINEAEASTSNIDVTERNNLLYKTEINQNVFATEENSPTTTEITNLRNVLNIESTTTNNLLHISTKENLDLTDNSHATSESSTIMNDITNSFNYHAISTDVNGEITNKKYETTTNNVLYTTETYKNEETTYIATEDIADRFVTRIEDLNQRPENLETTTETITTLIKNQNMNITDSSYTTSENVVSIYETTNADTTYITEQLYTTENQNVDVETKDLSYITEKNTEESYAKTNKNFTTTETSVDILGRFATELNKMETRTNFLEYTTEYSNTNVTEQSYTESGNTVTTHGISKPTNETDISSHTMNSTLTNNENITVSSTETDPTIPVKQIFDRYIIKLISNKNATTENVITVNELPYTTENKYFENTTTENYITNSDTIGINKNKDIEIQRYVTDSDISTNRDVTETTSDVTFDGTTKTTSVTNSIIAAKEIADKIVTPNYLNSDLSTINDLVYTTDNKIIIVLTERNKKFDNVETTFETATNFYTTKPNEILNSFSAESDVTHINLSTLDEDITNKLSYTTTNSNVDGTEERKFENLETTTESALVTNDLLYSTEINLNKATIERNYETFDNVVTTDNILNISNTESDLHITTTETNVGTISDDILNRFATESNKIEKSTNNLLYTTKIPHIVTTESKYAVTNDILNNDITTTNELPYTAKINKNEKITENFFATFDSTIETSTEINISDNVSTKFTTELNDIERKTNVDLLEQNYTELQNKITTEDTINTSKLNVTETEVPEQSTLITVKDISDRFVTEIISNINISSESVDTTKTPEYTDTTNYISNINNDNVTILNDRLTISTTESDITSSNNFITETNVDSKTDKIIKNLLFSTTENKELEITEPNYTTLKDNENTLVTDVNKISQNKDIITNDSSSTLYVGTDVTKSTNDVINRFASDMITNTDTTNDFLHTTENPTPTTTSNILIASNTNDKITAKNYDSTTKSDVTDSSNNISNRFGTERNMSIDSTTEKVALFSTDIEVTLRNNNSTISSEKTNDLFYTTEYQEVENYSSDYTNDVLTDSVTKSSISSGIVTTTNKNIDPVTTDTRNSLLYTTEDQKIKIIEDNFSLKDDLSTSVTEENKYVHFSNDLASKNLPEVKTLENNTDTSTNIETKYRKLYEATPVINSNKSVTEEEEKLNMTTEFSTINTQKEVTEKIEMPIGSRDFQSFAFTSIKPDSNKKITENFKDVTTESVFNTNNYEKVLKSSLPTITTIKVDKELTTNYDYTTEYIHTEKTEEKSINTKNSSSFITSVNEELTNFVTKPAIRNNNENFITNSIHDATSISTIINSENNVKSTDSVDFTKLFTTTVASEVNDIQTENTKPIKIRKNISERGTTDSEYLRSSVYTTLTSEVYTDSLQDFTSDLINIRNQFITIEPEKQIESVVNKSKFEKSITEFNNNYTTMRNPSVITNSEVVTDATFYITTSNVNTTNMFEDTTSGNNLTTEFSDEEIDDDIELKPRILLFTESDTTKHVTDKIVANETIETTTVKKDFITTTNKQENYNSETQTTPTETPNLKINLVKELTKSPSDSTNTARNELDFTSSTNKLPKKIINKISTESSENSTTSLLEDNSTTEISNITNEETDDSDDIAPRILLFTELPDTTKQVTGKIISNKIIETTTVKEDFRATTNKQENNYDKTQITSSFTTLEKDIIKFPSNSTIFDENKPDFKTSTKSTKNLITQYHEESKEQFVKTSTIKSYVKTTDSSTISSIDLETKIYEKETEFVCNTTGRFIDKNSCSTFYLCFKVGSTYKQMKLQCPSFSIFHPKRLICTTDLKACENRFKCKTSGVFPDEENEHKFYICFYDFKEEQYVSKHLHCPSRAHFNRQTSKCVIFSENDIKPKLNNDDDNNSDETSMELSCTCAGKFPIEGSCKHYYYCIRKKDEFKLKVKKCGRGKLYDKNLKRCRSEKFVTCDISEENN